MGEPMKYRKRPVIIEAMELRGDNLESVIEWCGGEWLALSAWPSQVHLATYERKGQRYIPALLIHTLEGDHEARGGDFIIKGVAGEFYPCKPDIFAQTYELAEPGEKVTPNG